MNVWDSVSFEHIIMSQIFFAYVIEKGTGNWLDWIESRLDGRDVLPC